MTKFLVAILFLATNIKVVSGCTFISCDRNDVAELSLQGDESQKEKEESKSKNNIEDKIFSHFFVNTLLNRPARLLTLLHQQDAYLGFLNDPITPPPDTI